MNPGVGDGGREAQRKLAQGKGASSTIMKLPEPLVELPMKPGRAYLWFLVECNAIKRQDVGCREGRASGRTRKPHVCSPEAAGESFGEREENKEGGEGETNRET